MARHHVTRSQILGVRRVALHETLAIAVEQNAAFAAHAFGDQHARAGHAGRVELPEFHVFQRNAGANGHAQAITGVDEGVGRCGENAASAASGEQHRLACSTEISPVSISSAVTPTTSPSASRIRSSAIHLTKNWVLAHIALVQACSMAVTSVVSHGAGGCTGSCRSWPCGRRTDAEILPFFQTVKRHAEVLELDHGFGRLAAP